jgi:hypothetical protein
MYVQVKALSEPKTEHRKQMNEDAYAIAPERGLFVVADGAGTKYRSGEWAQALVRHFLDVPLTSADEFEVHWWLLEAQQGYQPHPSVQTDWKVQQKAREGGASTLCGMRMTSVQKGSAKAQVFALGDSCLFLNAGSGTVDAFPLQDAAAFGHAPRCLPSLPQHYRRTFHRLASCFIDIVPGTTILLVTDAVARWVLSHSAGQGQWEAFRGIAGMNETTWSAFLAGCRASGAMVDDDATALILSFTKEPRGSKLRATPPHADSLVEKRQRLLAEAIKIRDHERIALLYGDGKDCGQVSLSHEEVQATRRLAQALDELRSTFLTTFGSPGAAMQVAAIWQKHQELFEQEQYRTSVANVLHHLQQHGLLSQVALPPSPVSSDLRPGCWSRLRAWLREEWGI